MTPAASPLFRPLRLGSREIPNRIVLGAQLSNYGRGNRYTPRHCAYYAERAAGGVGLIITEALTVHPLDWPYEHAPFGHTDAILDSLHTLRTRIHKANPHTRLLAQLNHTGAQQHSRPLRQSPWGPSAVADVASRTVARAMLVQEIAEVIAGFAAAAARVLRAGWDGVELNAAQYSLLRQFLSPLTNHRTDAYGGTWENRLRALQETIAAVRAAIGKDAILGVKLCGDELAPWGGLSAEDAQRIAAAIVCDPDLPRVDYLSVQPGGPFSVALSDAPIPTPQGEAVPLAAGVRQAIQAKRPVFAEGRLEDPALAEELLRREQVDALVMSRALLSDPHWPRKWCARSIAGSIAGSVASSVANSIAQGVPGSPCQGGSQHMPKSVAEEAIRPHVGMPRYFSVRGDWNRPLSDLSNPRAGREEILPPLRGVAEAGAAEGGAALVLGGGPAGLEAASTLAARKWEVHLIEREARLGGLARTLAEALPGCAEYGALADYYETLVTRAGVHLRTGVTLPEASQKAQLAAFLELERYALVLLANGAEALPPPFPCAEGSVYSARELLQSRTSVELPPPQAGRVLVVDEEGGYPMACAVEYLLARGHAVEVISADFYVGRELSAAGDIPWFTRVGAQGVRLHPLREPLAYSEQTLRCRIRFSTREEHFSEVACLIWAGRERPASTLLESLQSCHPAVYPIGDACAPRYMGEAILNAHRSALGELGVVPASAPRASSSFLYRAEPSLRNPK